MAAFRDTPIRRKLTLISMATTLVALVVACLTFTICDQIVLRRDLVADLSTTAQMIGFNSASALSFNDPESATRTLQGLGSQSHITRAGVYGREGNLFSAYRRKGMDAGRVPLAPEADGSRFGAGALRVFQPIRFDGERMGTIYLESDLDEIQERRTRSLTILVVVMLGAGLLAYVMIARLQRVISEPVSQLAAVAKQVAAQNDYSMRARRNGNDELGQLIDGFNHMLAQIEARNADLKQAQDSLERRVTERTGELAHSLSLLNATLDSTADGILAVDLQGRILCFNSRFVLIWKCPPELMARRNRAEVVAHVAAQTKDPTTFIHRVHEIFALPALEAFDVIELRDGRVFERFVHPQRVDGRNIGVVISFRDITERRRSETKLAETHRQLVDASRQAGMAEVATGVLHNVGNVLNSVNVSATLLTDEVRASKAANLPKIAALLREHNGDLVDFLTRDPKGQRIPAYLITIADQIAAEQTKALEELAHLRKNIEHIKEIVAMQQSYARISGVTETVAVAELVEDALRMNAGGLARHGLEITRDFAPGLFVNVDRHKVLQILVNLIQNAKQACDEVRRPDKRLTTRAVRVGTLVRISVTDNGVGIPAENLTRIFAHGFTTRKDGHGFGLHSGALVAKELGGSLSVQSDGTGKGAVFTLELPSNHEVAG